ncbi:MAG: hypothetical protein ABI794_03815 [Betaproteobacteria bacterium]
MNSIRTQVAVIAAIAALGIAGSAAADAGVAVKSRVYTQAQDWTGGGAPDSAFTKANVVKSRKFDTVAADTIAGPAPVQATQAVRTLNWDNAPAWIGREGGPVVTPVSQALSPLQSRNNYASNN